MRCGAFAATAGRLHPSAAAAVDSPAGFAHDSARRKWLSVIGGFMWTFSLSDAIGLLGRTAPFLLFRVGVYFGIGVAYVLATGAGAGIGWGIGAFGDAEFRAGAIFWGGALGFGLTAGVLYFLREYLLYIVKAGHVAVMVEALEGRPLPEGQSQIAFARAAVADRFAQASVLFAMDQLVKGVARAITGLVQGVLSLLPVPGLQNAMGLLRAFLRVAVGLVDEVILAHAFRVRAENPWEAGRDALVLYAQNARPMLVNAVWLTLFVYGLSILVFLVMLAPAALAVALIPGDWSAGGFVFALVFAWAVKAAVIEPFAIACLLQVYFRPTENQTPNPDWTAKLDNVSDKFRTMRERALSWPRRDTA